MSHVLEHLPKEEIIGACRGHPIHAGGRRLILRGCAQRAVAHTGCYWAYEDFTHRTMFTSGSLLYVLRAAGFSSVRFLDLKGWATPWRTRWLNGALYGLHRRQHTLLESGHD